MATELPSQADVGMLSAQVFIALSVQDLSSPVRSVFSSIRDFASVSTRPGCKRSHDDESSSPVKLSCTGERLLCTRLEISLVCELPALPVQKAVREGRETNVDAALPSSASTISAARMEVSVFISRFPHWLDGRRFLNIALKGALSHVMNQTCRCDSSVGA